jgi:hypothetical protein
MGSGEQVEEEEAEVEEEVAIAGKVEEEEEIEEEIEEEEEVESDVEEGEVVEGMPSDITIFISIISRIKATSSRNTSESLSTGEIPGVRITFPLTSSS